MMLATLHQHAPKIRDWCAFCRSMTDQANGFTAERVTATQCRDCGALLLWP